MNEVSNIKAPGWQRVVSDLTTPIADDRMWLLRLLGVLGQVSGARQAIFFQMVTAGGENAVSEARPAQVWPLAPGMLDEQGRLRETESAMDPSRVDSQSVERPRDVQGAARAVAASRQVAVFALEEDGMYDGGTGKWFVVGVPVSSGLPHEASSLPLRGVVTLLVESRSRQALQSVAALVEVLAGYVFGHEAQQALRRTRQASAALDLAARLIAAINAAQGFKGCTLQLVNDLCRQLSADRVGLGWMRGSPSRWSSKRRAGSERPEKRELHLLALSDTENVDRRMEMCRRIEAAMEECLDQEQAVLFPAPPAEGPGADVLLSQTIVLAHRELARNDANLRLASFPLRIADARGERIAGVVLVESSGATRLDPAHAELIQATLDLIAPVLAVRASDDRSLALRTWDWLLKSGAWFVGPRHTVWKIAGVAVMAATATMFLWRTTYRVGAPMHMQPLVARTIAAPISGTILRIPEGVQSGAKLGEGDILLEMDTRELVLAGLEAQAQAQQSERQEAEALKKGDQAAASQARARAQASQAKVDLYYLQVAKSTIRAPIAGTIISPDIRDKVGATVKIGDPLFEVADMSSMVVKVRVEDRDISFVRIGQTGEVSPKADPSRAVPFTVDQIVPLARAVDGKNAFEVRGTLAPGVHEPWFLPGLEGQAKLNTEKRSLAWIASRRIVDQLRVWLWW